ncbi:hypothetical protein V5E97_00665 [Singulisphaera sp. Ch08]|uniref:Uncharacterized protein n=1 Tax=Singulisphaera sp. Ch08 TaxID=3120278 RepID=A0AAU7CH25_9BACT
MNSQEAHSRRFLISDAIVLVASTALLLSTGRALRLILLSLDAWFNRYPELHPYEIRLTMCSIGLASLSLPLLISILIRSADRLRLRRGVPGLFVHLAVGLVVTVRLLGWASRAGFWVAFEGKLGFYGRVWGQDARYYLQEDFKEDIAIAVLVTWLTLKIVGQWNPERAWDDRLGRLVGVLWVIFYLGARLLSMIP